jgi:hypothetical protein
MVPKLHSFFGITLALSNGRFVVGALGASNCVDSTDQGPVRGATYVFGETQQGWAAEQCFVPATEANTLFGAGLALLGGSLGVGEPWEPSGSPDDPTDNSKKFAGSAHLYRADDSGAWQPTAYVKETPEIWANEGFGASLAMAPGRLAVGAPLSAGGEHAQDPATYAGAVYLFSVPSVEGGQP